MAYNPTFTTDIILPADSLTIILVKQATVLGISADDLHSIAPTCFNSLINLSNYHLLNKQLIIDRALTLAKGLTTYYTRERPEVSVITSVSETLLQETDNISSINYYLPAHFHI